MPTACRRVSVCLTAEVARSLRVLGVDPKTVSAGQLATIIGREAEAVEKAGRELERKLSGDEWCAIADVLNGCADLWESFGPSLPSLLLIAAEVEDGQRVDGLGDKWFGGGNGDAAIKKLIGKLRSFTPAHGEAILAAVRFFWANTDAAAPEKWWTVAARTEKREAERVAAD